MEDQNLKKEPPRFDGAIKIPASLKGSFFRFWFDFLEPIHKLTDREMDVMASFVKHRYELSKIISDEDLLDTVVMSDDTRRKIREDCNISIPHFQGILNKLRKSKLIIDNKINKKFIPQLSKDSKSFKYLLYFDLNEPE